MGNRDELFDQPKLNYSVEIGATENQCLKCGNVVQFKTDSKSMSKCSKCGSIVLNPRAIASSVKSAPDCEFCDDTGFVMLPVSGNTLYITAARCTCQRGNEMSSDVLTVPDDMLQPSGGRGSETFMGRRKAIHDAMERSRGKSDE